MLINDLNKIFILTDKNVLMWEKKNFNFQIWIQVYQEGKDEWWIIKITSETR